MNKETILGVIRHALTFGGGLLAGKGILAGDDVTQGVAAVITLVGIVWSALQKKKAAKDLALAVAAPAGDDGK